MLNSYGEWMGLFKGRVGNMRSDRRRQGWNGMEWNVFTPGTYELCSSIREITEINWNRGSLSAVCVCLTEDEIGM
jgi:hypothetical protein